MPRRFVAELQEHENLDQVFLVADKQLRANRQGNLYLQLRLSDKTGSLNTMLWNATEAMYSSFDNGDFLRVKGTTQIHNGSLQMIASKVERANPRDVNEPDFVTLNSDSITKMASRVAEILRSLRDVHLRNLAEAFLIDEQFMAKFTAAPAGVKNHHAYRGGLLEHVLSLMELTAVVAPRYPDLDAETLLMGAFLHDLGKIDELTYERDLGYSDEGQLIGHLVMGVAMLDEKIRQAEKLSSEKFPPDLQLRLKHLIVSHHGEHEFGSPKVPMTLEAVALHFLDNLDAKMHSISQLLREDANSDSHWTPFQASLGRKFFKPTNSREKS
jgi:3'-5' exoribonuclease